jgi:hypothetical protein
MTSNRLSSAAFVVILLAIIGSTAIGISARDRANHNTAKIRTLAEANRQLVLITHQLATAAERWRSDLAELGQRRAQAEGQVAFVGMMLRDTIAPSRGGLDHCRDRGAGGSFPSAIYDLLKPRDGNRKTDEP